MTTQLALDIQEYDEILHLLTKAASWIHEAIGETIYNHQTGEPFDEDVDLLFEMYAAINNCLEKRASDDNPSRCRD